MVEFETNLYRVRYFKQISRSTLNDYDYDGVGGRYPCGYDNHIEFYDKIVSITPLCNIILSDDTINDMKLAIASMNDNFMIDNNNDVAEVFSMITIQVPPADNLNKELFISISRENIPSCGERIVIIFIFQVNGTMETGRFSIMLDQREAEAFYIALDDDCELALSNEHYTIS